MTSRYEALKHRCCYTCLDGKLPIIDFAGGECKGDGPGAWGSGEVNYGGASAWNDGRRCFAGRKVFEVDTDATESAVENNKDATLFEVTGDWYLLGIAINGAFDGFSGLNFNRDCFFTP